MDFFCRFFFSAKREAAEKEKLENAKLDTNPICFLP